MNAASNSLPPNGTFLSCPVCRRRGLFTAADDASYGAVNHTPPGPVRHDTPTAGVCYLTARHLAELAESSSTPTAL